MIYSIDLGDFESGEFTATRYPDGCGVSGDHVVAAANDKAALKLLKKAAENEWAAPENRDWDDFKVEFIDSLALTKVS